MSKNEPYLAILIKNEQDQTVMSQNDPQWATQITVRKYKPQSTTMYQNKPQWHTVGHSKWK